MNPELRAKWKQSVDKVCNALSGLVPTHGDLRKKDLKPAKPSNDKIFSQIYYQLRVNLAFGDNYVDIVASKEYAEFFHRMLQRQYAEWCRSVEIKARVFKCAESTRVMGMRYLTYKDYQMLWPKCDVHVMILPKGYSRVFMIYDHHSGEFFDFCNPMSHTRKDTFAKTIQWAKHLRPFWKRKQAKRERNAVKKLMRSTK